MATARVEARRRASQALLPGLSLLAALIAGGCGSIFGSDKPELVSADPASTIYGKAERMVDEGDYEDAARQYEQVDINHPYSQEARRSIVMSSYAYYKAGKYDEAVASADRYLTLHPGTGEADLAQNIIGMSYYDRVLDPKRDQTFARRGMAAYDKLLQRYPSSRYAAEAANRARILRDLIAASEMQVGRYYLRRNNFLAAINRFRTVVTEYQTTQQVEEALMRLTEAYVALGIINEAQTAAAVLGHNFPDSKWYKHAYGLLGKQGLQPQEHEGSWITRTWRGRGQA